MTLHFFFFATLDLPNQHPFDMKEGAAFCQAVLLYQPFSLNLNLDCGTVALCSPACLALLLLTQRGQINGTLPLSNVIIEY